MGTSQDTIECADEEFLYLTCDLSELSQEQNGCQKPEQEDIALSEDQQKSLLTGNIEQLVFTSTYREWVPLRAVLTPHVLTLESPVAPSCHSIAIADIVDIIALQSLTKATTWKLAEQVWNQRHLASSAGDTSLAGWCFGFLVAGDCRGNIFRCPTPEARAEWVQSLRLAATAAAREHIAKKRAALSPLQRARESAEAIRSHRSVRAAHYLTHVHAVTMPAPASSIILLHARLLSPSCRATDVGAHAGGWRTPWRAWLRATSSSSARASSSRASSSATPASPRSRSAARLCPPHLAAWPACADRPSSLCPLHPARQSASGSRPAVHLSIFPCRISRPCPSLSSNISLPTGPARASPPVVGAPRLKARGARARAHSGGPAAHRRRAARAVRMTACAVSTSRRQKVYTCRRRRRSAAAAAAAAG